MKNFNGGPGLRKRLLAAGAIIGAVAAGPACSANSDPVESAPVTMETTLTQAARDLIANNTAKLGCIILAEETGAGPKGMDQYGNDPNGTSPVQALLLRTRSFGLSSVGGDYRFANDGERAVSTYTTPGADSAFWDGDQVTPAAIRAGQTDLEPRGHWTLAYSQKRNDYIYSLRVPVDEPARLAYNVAKGSGENTGVALTPQNLTHFAALITLAGNSMADQVNADCNSLHI